MSTSAYNAAAKPIAITSGDPAGIGPELCLQLTAHFPNAPLVVLGDIEMLRARAELLSLDVTLNAWKIGDTLAHPSAKILHVLHCPAGAAITPGRPDPLSAAGTLNMLRTAANGCLNETFSAMVTAPLAKNIICEGADKHFTGHTEFLAELAGASKVVMMLATSSLRVALATTHLPLRNVADAIQYDDLIQTIEILYQDLNKKFAIASPRILVLGLNPHAGEGGHLGREEIDVIIPALEALRAKGMRLTGPAPADTAFNPELLEQHDAVLAMYHDQGLPVLKFAGFGEAVNITLGLPFIRTSVDHGTAFELAGSGRARIGSLVAATQMAIELVDGAQSNAPNTHHGKSSL